MNKYVFKVNTYYRDTLATSVEKIPQNMFNKTKAWILIEG